LVPLPPLDKVGWRPGQQQRQGHRWSHLPLGLRRIDNISSATGHAWISLRATLFLQFVFDSVTEIVWETGSTCVREHYVCSRIVPSCPSQHCSWELR
jgi:hypothetical protein